MKKSASLRTPHLLQVLWCLEILWKHFSLPLAFLFFIYLALRVNMDNLWIKDSQLLSNLRKNKTAQSCDV